MAREQNDPKQRDRSKRRWGDKWMRNKRGTKGSKCKGGRRRRETNEENNNIGKETSAERQKPGERRGLRKRAEENKVTGRKNKDGFRWTKRGEGKQRNGRDGENKEKSAAKKNPGFITEWDENKLG